MDLETSEALVGRVAQLVSLSLVVQVVLVGPVGPAASVVPVVPVVQVVQVVLVGPVVDLLALVTNRVYHNPWAIIYQYASILSCGHLILSIGCHDYIDMKSTPR